MATVIENNASERLTALPDDAERRSLYKRLFNPRISTPIDYERTTYARLGIPGMFMRMKELGAILHQILDLANGEAEDDDGILAPTKHAMVRTTRLLMHASMVVWKHCADASQKFIFPRGHVSTDPQGGVRIEWTKASASLRLVIAGDESGKSYLYFEFGDKFGSERQLSADLIGHWLIRFMAAK